MCKTYFLVGVTVPLPNMASLLGKLANLTELTTLTHTHRHFNEKKLAVR